MDNIFTGVSATTTTPDNNDFPIDDLLDFSSADDDDYSPSSSTTTASGFFPHLPPLPSSAITSLLFTDYDLFLPSDDVAQLEWLSQFVEDSFIDSPANSLDAALDTSSHDITCSGGATSASASGGRPRQRKETSRAAEEEGRSVRRCRHCASEKTPQWRTGPLGPKTLCNACGVRFKSGRLVPEYRPAASPTFVLTHHSNSHRKVLELRRQKEMVRQQQLQPQKFVVC